MAIMQIVGGTVSTAGKVLTARLLRQISFPTPLRAFIELLMFAGTFVAACYISLGVSFTEMLWPMIPVLVVIMLANVLSGVYRTDINHTVMNLYAHTAYGLLLISLGFLAVIGLFFPDFYDSKFIFFFLFFSFFVSNTIRPLISGTDFMDGGGRRQN